jgi:hypothetical protein
LALPTQKTTVIINPSSMANVLLAFMAYPFDFTDIMVAQISMPNTANLGAMLDPAGSSMPIVSDA